VGGFRRLMYASKDPSVAGIVLDSPFSTLNTLVLELVDFYKIPLPKFSVSRAPPSKPNLSWSRPQAGPSTNCSLCRGSQVGPQR